MVLQGLVDHHGRFTDINAAWSGRVHDGRIFQNSVLFKLMVNGLFALWTLMVWRLVQLFWET